MLHRPEVDERKRSVGAPDHVRRLDVAMNDRRRTGVEVAEHIGGTLQKAPSFVLGEALARREKRCQRLALHAFHHQVQRSRFFEMLVVARQRRVIQRCQHRGFALGEPDRGINASTHWDTAGGA
jgi:hypothetical protein